MRDVQRKFDLSPGDFPAGADLHEFVTRLRQYDFTDFYKVPLHLLLPGNPYPATPTLTRQAQPNPALTPPPTQP